MPPLLMILISIARNRATFLAGEVAVRLKGGRASLLIVVARAFRLAGQEINEGKILNAGRYSIGCNKWDFSADPCRHRAALKSAGTSSENCMLHVRWEA